MTVLSRRLLSPGAVKYVRDDIGKYESDMARKTYPSPPSPGPFDDSADRYADWKSLMKLACTAFSVERPRNRLFLQSGDGTTRLSNLPFSCDGPTTGSACYPNHSGLGPLAVDQIMAMPVPVRDARRGSITRATTTTCTYVYNS